MIDVMYSMMYRTLGAMYVLNIFSIKKLFKRDVYVYAYICICDVTVYLLVMYAGGPPRYASQFFLKYHPARDRFYL